MTEKFITSDKIFYHLKKLNDWNNGEIVSPITVEIHPCNVCNNNCYYCFAKSQRDGTIMKTGDAFEVIKKLKQAEIKGLIFSGGGEPTLHPDFAKIILYAKKQGFEIGIITNGVAMDNRLKEAIIRNVTWIRISLDASNTELYEKIRGVNTFDQVINNTKDLVKMKKRFRKNCTIGLQSVITKYNVRDQIELTKLASALDADYLQIRPLENERYSKSLFNEAMNQGRLSQILHKKERLAFLFSKKWEVIDPNSNLRKRGFSKCWCYPFIGAVAADGNIYICCHFVGIKDFCYGNLITDDLDEILKKREVIAKHIDLRKCPKACRGSHINRRLEGLKQGIEHLAFL